MKLKTEKPMIKIGNKPMILHVLEALKKSKRVSKIFVAVSKYTPKTAEFVNKLGLDCVETPGKGYVYDMHYAIKLLRLGKVLIISADLPFIKEKMIDEIVQSFEKCNRPAMTVAVPLEVYEGLGITTNHVFEVNGRKVAPAGLNIIDGTRITETEKELEEKVLIVNWNEIAVNVNTVDDLEVARKLVNVLR